MKLIIHECGDSSVGLQERYYYVDCPFERDEIEATDLHDFKRYILSAFREYAEMKMTAFYDFEKN